MEIESKTLQKNDYVLGVDSVDKLVQILTGRGSQTVSRGMDTLKYSEIAGKILQGKYSEAASDILSMAGDKLIGQIPLVGQVKTAVDLGNQAAEWLNSKIDRSAWETLKRKVEEDLEEQPGLDEHNIVENLWNDYLENSKRSEQVIDKIARDEYGRVWDEVQSEELRNYTRKKIEKRVKKMLEDYARGLRAKKRLADELRRAHARTRP